MAICNHLWSQHGRHRCDQFWSEHGRRRCDQFWSECNHFWSHDSKDDWSWTGVSASVSLPALTTRRQTWMIFVPLDLSSFDPLEVRLTMVGQTKDTKPIPFLVVLLPVTCFRPWHRRSKNNTKNNTMKNTLWHWHVTNWSQSAIVLMASSRPCSAQRERERERERSDYHVEKTYQLLLQTVHEFFMLIVGVPFTRTFHQQACDVDHPWSCGETPISYGRGSMPSDQNRL